MFNQDILNDVYTLWLSGAAKMKNDKEIEWVDEIEGNVTIEFPTLSSHYAVVRRYWSISGNLYWKDEYKDGLKHGRSITCYENGSIKWISEWQNGLEHGNSVWYQKDGSIDLQSKYENGKYIND